MRAILLASLLLASGVAESADAQSCHSPAGEWTLAPSESHIGTSLSFNPYYEIAAVHLSIRTDGSTISQSWAFKGPHLDRITHYKIASDGIRHPTTLQDAMDFEYIAISAEWQNCTLLVTGISQLFGMEIATTNTYVISVDGRQLTILQYGESPISVVDRQLVFRRSGSR